MKSESYKINWHDPYVNAPLAQHMDTTNGEVFSTRNGSPHVLHVLDTVLELLEEVLTPFQPTSATLSKSLPGQRNLFDIEIERAMDKLERERHVNLNLPMVLELPHAEVVTIKPRAPDEARAQALRYLNEARAQEKLSNETSRAPRMLDKTTQDLIITPTGPKDQIQRTTSNFQNILVRVRAKYLDVKARYKLLKHRKVLRRGSHGQAPEEYVQKVANWTPYEHLICR